MRRSASRLARLLPARFTVLVFAAFVLSLATLHSPLVYCQSTSATLNGQITDPTGKVIPGTAVQAVNIGTNITKGQVSGVRFQGTGLAVLALSLVWLVGKHRAGKRANPPPSTRQVWPKATTLAKSDKFGQPHFTRTHRALSTGFLVLIFILALSLPLATSAQSTSATLNGQITDPSGKVIPGTAVQAVNIDTNITYPSKSNATGIYVIPNLPPGRYRLVVTKDGFKQINKTDITLNVQDDLEQNFSLEVGSTSESVTVEGNGVNMNTTDGSVSTVVDRNFVESIPLNGRSLQPLITLTPGVVLTPASSGEQGQFSVNGQRADANYFSVDGVSANFGVAPSGASIGQGAAGTLPALNASGGTNSLVSIDAIQEFRIQTSSYAPEFGRSPGGQVSIATRSGTNQFHGDLFDYLRNNIFDAHDWFYNQIAATSPPGTVAKPQLRQNDFGGVLGGPIVRGRTFFFFSYEGLRLVVPTAEAGLVTVPDVTFRQSAPVSLQPLLNALPIPNGKNFGNGKAQFNASYSNPTTLNATSIRIDHKLDERVSFFGRYNYAPSSATQRILALTTLKTTNSKTQTVTLGSSQLITSRSTNDIRFNYSQGGSDSSNTLDTFGGAVPPSASLLSPSTYSKTNPSFAFTIVGAGNFQKGAGGGNSQKQFNLIDSATLAHGSHQMKFGGDYRQLRPSSDGVFYNQAVDFFGLTGPNGVQSGVVPFGLISTTDHVEMISNNLSLYAQDTWRLNSRVALSYGLRWEFNPPLHGASGTPLYSAQNLTDPANASLAPPGTPFYKTKYNNVAPRIGLAVQLSTKSGFETVVRGGFGAFYDLGVGEWLANGSYFFPYQRFNFFYSVPFPVPVADATRPPFSATVPPGGAGNIVAADPNLELPRTYQWNVAAEQSLGTKQNLTVTYVGALGQELLRQQQYTQPNSTFYSLIVVNNSAASNYHALQIQYQRRMSHGFQALAFYSLSHCIDDASNDSSTFGSNARIDRGNCDYDTRDALHGALTYDIPGRESNKLTKAVLGGWAVDTIFALQTAAPVDLNTGVTLATVTENVTVRPDVVPGIPLYLSVPQNPGGKVINGMPGVVTCPDGSPSVGPFCNPPVDTNGNPLRQGNLGRNVLRGFGISQIDFAARRDFNFTDQWKLQFSAEAFNIFNHPNFGNIDNCTCDSPGSFGQATQMLNNALGAGQYGGFNPLYQVGGPRSIQLALKLKF
jgi:hypothetical protein